MFKGGHFAGRNLIIINIGVNGLITLFLFLAHSIYGINVEGMIILLIWYCGINKDFVVCFIDSYSVFRHLLELVICDGNCIVIFHIIPSAILDLHFHEDVNSSMTDLPAQTYISWGPSSKSPLVYFRSFFLFWRKCFLDLSLTKIRSLSQWLHIFLVDDFSDYE